MFGLTVVTKTEKLLWRAQVESLQDEIKRLHEEISRERNRAEAAVNALLAKAAHVVLSPNPTEVESDREVTRFEEVLDRTYGLFEDDEAKLKQEADILERLQS